MTTLARLCHRFRFGVVGLWVAVLVGLAVLALGHGAAFTDTTNLPDSESAQAYSLLSQADPAGQAMAGAALDGGVIVWHTDASVDDPALQARVATMVQEVASLPGVAAVTSPYDQAGQLNEAAGTAYASVIVTGDVDLDAVRQAADTLAGDGVQVAIGGGAFTEHPTPSSGTEVIGIVAALAILLLMFRSGWAALLPIVTGLVGVAVSMLAVILASHVVNLASTSLTMGALIGLGVGIDYALFIVNRFRKALLTGSSVGRAVGTALNTSGRAVIFAGLTVVVALLGMYVVNLGILTGMAQAAALTVLVTVLAAITLLPALLGMLGPRVLSRRQRRAQHGGAEPTEQHRAASRWARVVQRVPGLATVVALLAIVALALPVLQLRVGDSDASSDPVGSASHSYYELMTPAFGAGIDAPLLLVAQTPDAASAHAFDALVTELPALPGVASATLAPTTDATQVAVATVIPTTSAQARQTADLVDELRSTAIPAAQAGTALHVHVGGPTATSIDLGHALVSKLPLYLGIVALLGFVLLAVAFRSLLLPLVGALSNLATLLVALGAVTAIFQLGWGSQLLGVGTGAPIMYLAPVLVVGIVFGLSMDYQVFLVSRMHEEWVHTHDNRHAIKVGLAETTRVIVAAATIMLCVFASFGFSGERIISMIGIGLAIGVLVDAFVVRLTLMPALMTLIGRRIWHYPRWAQRITPHLSVEGGAVEGGPVAGRAVEAGAVAEELPA